MKGLALAILLTVAVAGCITHEQADVICPDGHCLFVKAVTIQTPAELQAHADKVAAFWGTAPASPAPFSSASSTCTPLSPLPSMRPMDPLQPLHPMVNR